MSAELWLPVAGYEGFYEVSNCGRVRSIERTVKRSLGHTRIQRARILKARLSEGYPAVGLHRDGIRRNERIHVLVAAAFIGPRPDGLDVAHDDGDRTNCRSSNLRYDTRAGNLADKIAHGTANRGERNAMSKLTAEQVAAIRSATETQRVIAAHFGTSQPHVSRIRRGLMWADEQLKARAA